MKNTFASQTFASKTFACGTWAGAGAATWTVSMTLPAVAVLGETFASTAVTGATWEVTL